jgi:hypothetical protein
MGVGAAGREGHPSPTVAQTPYPGFGPNYGAAGATAQYTEFPDTSGSGHRYRVYTDGTVEVANPGKNFPGFKLTKASNATAWNAIMADYQKWSRTAKFANVAANLAPALQQAAQYVQQRQSAGQAAFDASGAASAPGTEVAPASTGWPTWAKVGGGVALSAAVLGLLWWALSGRKKNGKEEAAA